MKSKIGLMMVVLAVVSAGLAFSPAANAAQGLVGGQFGSDDFTDLEHMAELSSLDYSWTQSDGCGMQWSGIWQGSIEAPASGKITFTAETDREIQVLIAGKQVVEASKSTASGTVSMSKGKAYPIEVRYVQQGGGSYDGNMKVQWSWAGQAAISIPDASLTHTAEQAQQWSEKGQSAEDAADEEEDDDEEEGDGDNDSGHDDDGDADGPIVAFKYAPTGLNITIGGKPFASYFTGSSKIPRPYFAHVRTPSGVQVTRNHPPIEGKDSTDHDTYHPGLWLTFAGINGNDYWRLKKKTEHEMYIGKPQGGPGKGTFTVSNFFLDAKDSTGNRIANETCKYTILARENYYLLIYDSIISSDEHDLEFGDDQEYGLGIRVQTQIEEKFGGQILNADGLKGAEKAYGKASNWCDYSGVMDDTLIGMTVMTDPANIRPSWYHTRNYGLIAANLFGREKVAGLEPDNIKVAKGEKFHLGFGVAIYSGAKGSVIDRDAMYKDYLKVISKK